MQCELTFSFTGQNDRQMLAGPGSGRNHGHLYLISVVYWSEFTLSPYTLNAYSLLVILRISFYSSFYVLLRFSAFDIPSTRWSCAREEVFQKSIHFQSDLTAQSGVPLSGMQQCRTLKSPRLYIMYSRVFRSDTRWFDVIECCFNQHCMRSSLPLLSWVIKVNII